MTPSLDFRNGMSLNHLQSLWWSSVDFEQISPKMPQMVFHGWRNVCNLIVAGQTLHIPGLFVFIHSIPQLHADNQPSHSLYFKDSLQCFQTLPPGQFTCPPCYPSLLLRISSPY